MILLPYYIYPVNRSVSSPKITWIHEYINNTHLMRCVSVSMSLWVSMSWCMCVFVCVSVCVCVCVCVCACVWACPCAFNKSAVLKIYIYKISYLNIYALLPINLFLLEILHMHWPCFLAPRPRDLVSTCCLFPG